MSVFFLLLLLSCTSDSPQIKEDSIRIPIGGNAWVKGGENEQIIQAGLVQWSTPDAVLNTYVRLSKPGNLKLSLVSAVVGTSKARVIVNGISRKFSMQAGTQNEYFAGEWQISAPGYVKIELQGLNRTADTYGKPTEWLLEGSAVDESVAFVKNNEGNFFYWGRRGPSVHLKYSTPADEKVEWFYNELTVPDGQDVIGSYFMANGFAEGYFGMQVNSSTERRILFSVWSPYKTDDPKSIPKAQQIQLLRKGEGVHTGEFGNEGSGGQSYLKYNWVAGNTYRFLLRGKPSGDSTTTYSAYFFAPEKGDWQLIASFKRPRTHTYLRNLHSFLENFIPETGDEERRVLFGNQWMRSLDGRWLESTRATFTADATARKGYRMDYGGGSSGPQFFLKNCGFFNDYTEIGKEFERQRSGKVPTVDVDKLP